MDFAQSDRATELSQRLQTFLDELVFPAEQVYADAYAGELPGG